MEANGLVDAPAMVAGSGEYEKSFLGETAREPLTAFQIST